MHIQNMAYKRKLPFLLITAMIASLSGCGTQITRMETPDNGKNAAAVESHQEEHVIGNEVSMDMMKAAWDGRVMEILELLDKGVDPNIKGYNGITALSLAVQNNHLEIARKLLEHGADPNASDDKVGWFPLMWAAYNGFDTAVKLLLEHGAKVNQQNQFGETALIHAAFEGRDDTVRILLQNGADYTMENDKGFSALKAARNKGYFRIVEILTQAGAKQDEQSS